jgi:two-component system phosphate regulon response regulator PhoB
MVQRSILVVDDEQDILEVVAFSLRKAGYRVAVATSGEQALEMIPIIQPDLVILDIMLSGQNGLVTCSQIRENSAIRDLPILMLSARGDEVDVVEGFRRGADDYVQKPFSPRVLELRVRSLMRRYYMDTDDDPRVIKKGPLTLDPRRHEVGIDGESLQLTVTEFRILYLLASREGMVLPRDEIVDQVHGTDYPVTDRSIDVQMVGLRKKLGQYAAMIETVRGVGYRLREVAGEMG